MPRSMRLLVAACAVGVTASLLLAFGRSSAREAEAVDVLEATDGLSWRRGNIHTHSLWSDGDDYLEMIALWYRDRDYDFLCFTDHNVLANRERWIDVEKSAGKRKAYDKLKARFPDGWVEERTVDERLQVRLKTFEEVRKKIGKPGEFLLLQGEEISDALGRYPIHLNATNLVELVPPMRGESVYETIQNNVNAVVAQRERTGRPMIVHLNHPNFGYAVTAEDLMRVRGEKFFEVYNGHPSVHNRGDGTHVSTERLWDIVLTKRIAELGLPVMYGLATDDGHRYHNIPSRAAEPGRGWIMVLTDDLSAAALVAALEHGRFYASSGVTLERIASSPRGLEIAVRPEEGATYTIEFLGTRKGYEPEGEPVLDANGNPVRATRRYDEAIGAVLKTVKGTEARYEFTGDEWYVRARITSSKKHPNPAEVGEFCRAWVQPVVPRIER